MQRAIRFGVAAPLFIRVWGVFSGSHLNSRWELRAILKDSCIVFEKCFVYKNCSNLFHMLARY